MIVIARGSGSATARCFRHLALGRARRPERQQGRDAGDAALRPRGLASLSDEQKSRLRERLATRISKGGGCAWCAAAPHQHANGEEALRRFVALLQAALAELPQRRPTRATRASRERRLAAKKRRGRVKTDRSRRGEWDD